MNSKNIFLPVVGLMLLMSTSLVTAATCGSVTMTPDAGNSNNTGGVTCQASGGGNITVDSGTGVIDYHEGIDSGLAPLTGVTLASFNPTSSQPNGGTVGDFTFQDGSFSIASTVWDAWDSIYIAIKQANDNSTPTGGWGLFLVEAVIESGAYTTKSSDAFGISHFFAVGGKESDGITPPDGGEVPVPAAVWLFGSALFGLMGVSRKKKSKMA